MMEDIKKKFVDLRGDNRAPKPAEPMDFLKVERAKRSLPVEASGAGAD